MKVGIRGVMIQSYAYEGGIATREDFIKEVCSRCRNFLKCSMGEFTFGIIETGTIAAGGYIVEYDCSLFSAGEENINKIKEWVNSIGGKCEISG